MRQFLFRPSRRESGTARRVAFSPRLEALEDRCTPTAGALDPTFGNGVGYVTTSLSSFSDTASSVFVQPDGKILATGGSGATTGAGLVRYNSDGSLDGSFGTGGVELRRAASARRRRCIPSPERRMTARSSCPGRVPAVMCRRLRHRTLFR